MDKYLRCTELEKIKEIKELCKKHNLETGDSVDFSMYDDNYIVVYVDYFEDFKKNRYERYSHVRSGYYKDILVAVRQGHQNQKSFNYSLSFEWDMSEPDGVDEALETFKDTIKKVFNKELVFDDNEQDGTKILKANAEKGEEKAMEMKPQAEKKTEENQVNEKLVNHPNHYNKHGRRECWDEMRDLFGDVETINFCMLNAYKYLYRAGSKDGNSEEQDIKKAKIYVKKAKEIAENSYSEQAQAQFEYCFRSLAMQWMEGWLGNDE